MDELNAFQEFTTYPAPGTQEKAELRRFFSGIAKKNMLR